MNDQLSIYDGVTVAFDMDFISKMDCYNMARRVRASTGRTASFSNEYTPSDPADNAVYVYNPMSEGNRVKAIRLGFTDVTTGLIDAAKCFNILNSVAVCDDRNSCVIRLKFPYKVDMKKAVSRVPDTDLVRQRNTGYRRAIYTTRSASDDCDRYGMSRDGLYTIIIRYAGGRDYSNDFKKLRYIIDIVIESQSKPDDYAIKVAETKRREEKAVTNSFLEFSKKYPGVKLYVDLKTGWDAISHRFRDFDRAIDALVIKGGMRTGHINYDSDDRTIQVKNASMSNVPFVANTLFYECKFEGCAVDCKFLDSNVRNSTLKNCDIYRECLIKYSTLIDCNTPDDTSSAHMCKVENPAGITKLKMSKCSVRSKILNPDKCEKCDVVYPR